MNPTDGDPITQVLGLTNGLGAEYAFEVVGRADTVVQAYHSICPGGTAIVVGVAKPDDMVMIPALSLLQEKTLKGSIYGSARPSVDMLLVARTLHEQASQTRRVGLPTNQAGTGE